jgi:hypothetical protein
VLRAGVIFPPSGSPSPRGPNRPECVLSGGVNTGHASSQMEGERARLSLHPYRRSVARIPARAAIDNARTSVRESHAKPAQVTIEAGRPS